MTLREAWSIVKTAGTEWVEHKAMRLGAALAFYALLSLAPLLIITIAIAGRVFGEEAARGELVGQIRDLVGQQGAEAIQEILKHANQPSSGIIATLIGIATLLFGASGVFGELQDALNTIWEVRPKPGRAVLTIIRERFLSLLMVLGVGFLLLVSLVLSTALSAIGKYAANLFPDAGPLLQVANVVVSLAVVTLLFAMIFKVLPDVKLGWRDVFGGAVITALLFTLGKFVIGLYLGRSGVSSPFGAAGSLVALIVWVYYSTLILFFGAELTRAYVCRGDRCAEPDEKAEAVTDQQRAKEGLLPTGKPVPAEQAAAV